MSEPTEEQDLYQSISSERSIQENTAVPQSDKNNLINEQREVSRPIVFPQQPKQFPSLFQIHQKNAEKIRQLRAEVSKLQNNILEELRLKNSEPQIELSIEGIEEIDIGDYKIAEFQQRRKQRQNKLHKLSALYDSLRKVNKIEGFLFKEENHLKLKQMIKNKWNVQEFRVVSEWLIVLAKYQNYKTEVELEISQERMLQSGSNIFVSEEENEQPNEEHGYTVAVFSLPNLLHWMSPKQANLQLSQDSNRQKLQRCKQEAQMCRLIYKKIKISTTKLLLSASYSHKHQLIFILEQGGKVLVMNSRGKELSSIQLDKIDRVISMQILGNDLLIGTNDGVTRIYTVQKNAELKLKRIVICYCETLSEVIGFKAIGLQTIESINFCIGTTIYSYNLKTNTTSQVSQIAENEQIIGINREYRFNKLFQLLMNLSDSQRKIFGQKIKQNSQILKEWKGSCEVIHIYIQEIEKGEKRFHFLKANTEGQFELLTL